MAERDTAEGQLARLLHILPAAAREGGASISGLARDLNVAQNRVLADLEVLTERSFAHPAGEGDDIQVLLEADRVSIWTKGEFQRPVRLTSLEALCVAVGLRGSHPPADGAELRRRLEAQLAMTSEQAIEARLQVVALAPDAAGLRTALADALRNRAPCRFGYLKPHAEAPEVRSLEPWALVHAEGFWYAVGRDPERGEARAFRLDRMLGLEIRDGTYRIPPDADPAGFVTNGHLFFGGPDEGGKDAGPSREAVVRYSPAVARWIRERWQGTEDAEGGYRVRHPLGDPGWIVRHVLQYGCDAELERPAELRHVIRSTARRMAEAT